MLWGKLVSSTVRTRKEENLKSSLCPSRKVRKEHIKPKGNEGEDIGKNRGN